VKNDKRNDEKFQIILEKNFIKLTKIGISEEVIVNELMTGILL
jgi:hypothetical protein